MAVLDGCRLAVAEGPAGVLEPPGEVGVAAGPDPLVKAAEGGPGLPANEQVRGHRHRPVGGALEYLVLGEMAPRAGIARGELVLVRRSDDLASQGPRGVVRRRLEVAVEQPGPGGAVRVEEQEPVAAGQAGPDVARVVRRAQLGRARQPGAPAEGLRVEHGSGRVVDHDQLVGRAELQALERARQGCGARSIAGKWHYDADRGTFRCRHSRPKIRRESRPDAATLAA